MLLTVFAIILLGNIILTTNRGISNSSQVLTQTSIGIDCVSLATSTIEKAQRLPFDEHTKDSTWQNSLTALTPPASLGQEHPGDTLSDYDDYNGYPGGPNGSRTETDPLLTGIYKVMTQVHYVTRDASGNFVISTGSATWSKRLDIWVWNTADPTDTVKMTDIFSYWY